jgi:hypothetical protein
LMKLVRTVLNISNCGCCGIFFNMICRVLIKINQNPNTIHNLKEHKILTINMLIICKNQLFMVDFRQRQSFEIKVLVSFC